MSRSGYGFRIDNRDVDTVWLWVIDIDNKEEEIGVMEVDKKDVLSILESFFTNQEEGTEELRQELMKLYNWYMKLVDECGFKLTVSGEHCNIFEMKKK